MSVTRVSPEDARKLVADEGYVYVDVRSVPEFQAGHPTGAYNVPWKHMDARGAVDNEDFLPVMEKAFGKDAKLVLGCRSGGRSLQAAHALAHAGFAHLVDQRAGYMGTMGPTGEPEPGWAPSGLPTSQEAEPGHGYSDLEQKTK